MKRNWLAVSAACLALSACATTASDEIEARRISYIDALAMTDREELLSNIVRLRYNEVPVFLRVSQITSNVSTSRSADLATGLDPDWDFNGVGAESGITYRLNPTISYVPLSGRSFSNRLIVPFDLESVSLMLRNGFDFEVVANLMLVSMDGHSAERYRSQADHEKLRRLAREIDDLIKSGALIIGARTASSCGDTDAFEIVLIETGIGDETARNRLFAEFPAIESNEQGVRELPMCLTSNGAREDALAVRTRSLLSTLSYLSYGVDNPPEFDGFEWEVREDQVPNDLIRIQSGNRPPEGLGDSAIEYRGKWFWVEGSDRASNNTLYLMRVLLNLQAQVDEDADRAVQLTLPVN